MRILLISERLMPPFDEGIKNVAWQLARMLSRAHQVTVLTAFASDIPESGIHNVATNKLFMSLAMARAVRAAAPAMILYVPTACATLFSFARCRVLKALSGGIPVVMVALQWRPYGRLARWLMPYLCPDLVLVQSAATRASLAPFGCRVAELAPGVDLERFKPVDATRRHTLRQRYGLPDDTYVILHVGHMNRGRNVQSLGALQSLPGAQVVVIASSSTPHDAALGAELRAAGVRMVAEHVPEIAEWYQLADCYVFPVEACMSAIDLPLSVLEAMACDLPVVTTPFSGLVARFDEGPGFRYARGAQEMELAVLACHSQNSGGTRMMVARYDWLRVAQDMLATIARILNLRDTPNDGMATRDH